MLLYSKKINVGCYCIARKLMWGVIVYQENLCGVLLYSKTRRFSNHESRLLSRSHTFAIIVIFNRFENTSKYVDTLTLFSKNLNQRSLTPRWPLTPCLLRSHVWLYPRIIVSKSHDDTSMYVDTVINFANYHIHTYTYYVHTTYILHTTYRMSDHIVSYWTQFRRDKKLMWSVIVQQEN